MNKNPLPLSMPSSTKTIVGVAPDDVSDVSKTLVSPSRAQRTLLGTGGSQPEAIESFLSASRRDASEAYRVALSPPAGSVASKRTLVGLPSEPPPPPQRRAMPVSVPAEPRVMSPLALPQSFRGVSLSSMSLEGHRSTMPSIADLPYERPVIAAAAVATVVAAWALMMLYLFAI